VHPALSPAPNRPESWLPTALHWFYLNFGREVWSLQQKGISGASLSMECATLIAKRVARGLSLAVFEAIRSDVFNVSAPVGP
jgi:hypothetical protein